MSETTTSDPATSLTVRFRFDGIRGTLRGRYNAKVGF